MKKITSPFAGAVGAAFIASAVYAPVASAGRNPFQITSLASGYHLAEAGKTDAEGKCGEGKCGEGKCGGAAKEGTTKAKEGKCGEGKSGEGKCGAGKTPATKTQEGKCGGKKE